MAPWTRLIEASLAGSFGFCMVCFEGGQALATSDGVCRNRVWIQVRTEMDARVDPAFADFNGDGLLDAATERSILPGRGDGTFGSEIPIDDHLADPRFMDQSAADVNEDGLPDLLVGSGDVGNGCGAGLRRDKVYLSRGPAGFARAGWAEIGGGAGWPTDWDGDGRVDLVGGTFVGMECAIALLRGDGAGQFTMPSRLASRELEQTGSAFVVADFDGDGQEDMAALKRLDDQQTRIFLLRHTGDGLLQEASSIPVQSFDSGRIRGKVTTADVDNDGRPDILRWASDALVAALNRGGWVFETFEKTFGTAWIEHAAFADFDEDGFLDAALLLKESTSTTQSWRVEILAGDGMGGFTPTSTIPLGSEDFSWVAAGDVDNDGRADLAVGRYVHGFDVYLNRCADAERLAAVVPSVASAPGRYGAYFRTRLEMTNLSGESIDGRLVFHSRFHPGSEADTSLPFALNAGATLTFDDVLEEMKETGSGSLDVVVTAGASPLVRAEIYNEASSSPADVAAEKGIAPAGFLRLGNLGTFAVPGDLSGKRLAIGLRTFTEGATLRFTVRAAGGNVLHVVHRPFGPSRSLQLPADQFLLGYGLSGGETISVSVMAGGALVYGTVTDNATNAPSIQVLSRN